MRAAWLCLVFWLGASELAGQQSEPATRPGNDQIAVEYGRLSTALAAAADRTERIASLRAFITRFAAADPGATELLTARCRLGSILLTAFAAADAGHEFELVLDHAPSELTDLRGRALYGLAQSHELVGELREARDALRRTIAEARGTRYARFAQLAQQRLEHGNEPSIGSIAPEFGPRLDTTRQPRELADLRHGPALVAFVSLADADGLEELRTLLAAWTRAELAPDRGVIFAMHGTAEEATAAAKREQWQMPLILCDREFLDEAALTWGVRALPTTFLIGPDGTLLARDPTPRRIEDAVRSLR